MHETIDEFGDDVVAHQKEGNFHRLILCCKPPQLKGEWVRSDEVARVATYRATWNKVEEEIPF